jgi:hypothetical protein
MSRQRRLLLAALSAAWVGMVLACGGAGQTPSTDPAEQTIPYEVLKNKKRGDGMLIMSLLVSETASKQDVLKLAESLKRQHEGKYASISIFDSREAGQRADQMDESYPEKELSKHWLVVIDTLQTPSGEVRWIAEGRDH